MGRFGLQIRILREKLRRMMGSDLFLSIFENLVIWQFGYPAFYQAISIKSTFEPITTPLKWVLADAACKVSMIFFNIAPV